MGKKISSIERIGRKRMARPARLGAKRRPAARRSPATGARAAARAGETAGAAETGYLDMELVAIILPGDDGGEMMSAVVDRIDEPLEGFQVFDAVPEPVHIFTPDGVIRSCNAAFDELFEAPAGVYIGQHVTLLNPAETERNFRLLEEILDETLRNGVWKGTMTHRRWDGTEITTRAHVYPMIAAGESYLVCFEDGKEGSAGPAGRA